MSVEPPEPEMPEPELPEPETPEPELPEPVLRQAVLLVSAVLPDLAAGPTAQTALPPELRRLAGFTAGRRARLGGRAIAAALLADPALRVRAARASITTGRAGAGDAGVADPTLRAATAWLAGEEGWVDLVGAAAAEQARHHAGADAELEQLRTRLARAERALAEATERHRDEHDVLRTENTILRRRLGEARAAARAAPDPAHESAEERARMSARVSAQEEELRDLRARLAGQARDAAAARYAAAQTQAQTQARDEASHRVRQLVDTVAEAAYALRRELAQPPKADPVRTPPAAPSSAAPSSAAPSPDPGTGAPGSRARPRPRPHPHRGPAVESALVLERHLGMPHTRLLVDGYNVSKTAWPALSLEAQRSRLLTALAPLASRTGVEATVVFDAGAVAGPAPRSVGVTPRGVKVLFSPPGVIADDVIRDLVAVEPEGRTVVVVTADQVLAADVARAGARIAAPTALLDLLTRS